MLLSCYPCTTQTYFADNCVSVNTNLYIQVQVCCWKAAMNYWSVIQSIFEHLIKSPRSGWLYVFSSFPPPPPRPPPPHKRLSPLMSRPFELHLRYLGQRKYRSGEMYWMTFPWPWPKVTGVTLVKENLLVCTIKLEPITQSLQNSTVISP